MSDLIDTILLEVDIDPGRFASFGTLEDLRRILILREYRGTAEETEQGQKYRNDLNRPGAAVEEVIFQHELESCDLIM